MVSFRPVAILALAAAALAGVAKAADNTAPLPSPALWRVSDEDSTIYLFGSFSIVPAGSPWRSRDLAAALDTSETLWFEAPVGDPAATARANQIFEAEGKLGPGRSLATLLDPDRKAALEQAAASAGLTAGGLDALKPWAAFVVLSSRLYANIGFSLDESVDTVLMREAEGRGRRLRYFDTIDQSLGVLTAMPPDRQIDLLGYLLDDWSRQRAEAAAGFNAWRSGNAEATDAFLNDTMRAASPDIFDRLVSARIGEIAGEIAQILEGRETAFVSLNAGYVVGTGSLPDLLAARGFRVERVGAPPSEKLLRE